jgi:hypothetical protein
MAALRCCFVDRPGLIDLHADEEMRRWEGRREREARHNRDFALLQRELSPKLSDFEQEEF